MEQLDLPELERRWKESKSTIGRQMFSLAQIRTDLRALEQERACLRATPSEPHEPILTTLQAKTETLMQQRGEVSQLHQCSLQNHRFILQQLERATGHDWTSRARRSRNRIPITAGTPFNPSSQLKSVTIIPRSPDSKYGQSGGYC